jgi:CheY-like chemotaxis protein
MKSVRTLPILVVEDSDEDFDTLQAALRASGLGNEICRVTSGDRCLALLRSDSETTFHRPALVMMDLNTPGTDGRGALESMKADPALRDLPVVVLSTSANTKDLEFCYRVGANAYHVKPVRYGDHLQLMKNVFTYWLGSVLLPHSDSRHT